MIAFPRFDSRICDENAKKSLENYVGILQEAFKHYQNLLDSYIKLQEEHKQCNINSSSKMDQQPCMQIKEELLSQEQLNVQDIKQEHNSLLPELDLSYPSDTSPSKKPESSILPTSPVICRTHLNNFNTFARNITSDLDSVCDNSTSDMCVKTHHINKEVSAKCAPNLELSTTQHVETTFLPSGKKLKQSRLVFKKVPSTNVNKLTNTLPKVQEITRKDISVAQASTAVDNVNETVIDISPTQRSAVSKLRRCLQRKRKFASTHVKNSPKKKNNNSDRKDVIPTLTITTDTDTDTDSGSCTPEHYSMEMKEYKPFIKSHDTLINAFESIDNILASPLMERNNMPDVQIISPDKTKKSQQLRVDKIQTCGNRNNSEEETFCFSAEQSLNRDIDDCRDTDVCPSLNDTENKPPVNKLLTSSSKNEGVLEQLNMRCKSDRAKLRGRDCWECEKYYKILELSKNELQKRKNCCSRHRDIYERANTPEDFWNPEFPETLSSTYREESQATSFTDSLDVYAENFAWVLNDP